MQANPFFPLKDSHGAEVPDIAALRSPKQAAQRVDPRRPLPPLKDVSD